MTGWHIRAGYSSSASIELDVEPELLRVVADVRADTDALKRQVMDPLLDEYLEHYATCDDATL